MADAKNNKLEKYRRQRGKIHSLLAVLMDQKDELLKIIDEQKNTISPC